MRVAPPWFLKELKRIDPALYVRYDETSDSFEIIKDLAYFPPGSKRLVRESVIRAVFKHANDAALTELAKRKKYWQNECLCSSERQIAQIKRENAEAKRKRRDNAAELQAEGAMEAYRLATRKTFS